MSTEIHDPGFAPSDPMDGREPGEWDTRYDPAAKKCIQFESRYLGAHLGIALLLIFLIALYISFAYTPDASGTQNQTPASIATSQRLVFGWLHLAFAYIGGVLGGTVYSIKWLIHVVAKNSWNLDRRLWRVFIPHLSGALAVAFAVLFASGIVGFTDDRAVNSPWICLGISFLVGYFSDKATAKMAEVAETVFGGTRRGSHSDKD